MQSKKQKQRQKKKIKQSSAKTAARPTQKHHQILPTNKLVLAEQNTEQGRKKEIQPWQQKEQIGTWNVVLSGSSSSSISAENCLMASSEAAAIAACRR
jgi:hypothetical protein